jgi:hypothetical protein
VDDYHIFVENTSSLTLATCDISQARVSAYAASCVVTAHVSSVGAPLPTPNDRRQEKLPSALWTSIRSAIDDQNQVPYFTCIFADHKI